MAVQDAITALRQYLIVGMKNSEEIYGVVLSLSHECEMELRKGLDQKQPRNEAYRASIVNLSLVPTVAVLPTGDIFVAVTGTLVYRLEQE